jgi:inorganic pyrophosphatase
VITVFVELVPTDTVKVEIDKESGLLRLDRPQRYSSLSPEPYGFVPRTLCASRVAAVAGRALGRTGLAGDRDPLDVCVLTERTLGHAGMLVNARPIGGLRMFDGAEVDDKIIAVLENDPAYETWRDLADCPHRLVDRIQHYFLTYKDMPGTERRRSELAGTYGAAVAHDVIRAALEDYRAEYGEAPAPD